MRGSDGSTQCAEAVRWSAWVVARVDITANFGVSMVGGGRRCSSGVYGLGLQDRTQRKIGVCVTWEGRCNAIKCYEMWN